MPVCKFTKKKLSRILFHVLLHFAIHERGCVKEFAFIFSQYITITSSKKALKVCEYNFFQREVVLLVIYLFNHDSSKSTIFMLNMAFDILLSAVFVKYSKLESFVLICTLLLKPNYSPSWRYNFYFDICIKFTVSK